MPTPRPPDAGSNTRAPGAAPPLRRAWRCFARAHGVHRPPEAGTARLPPGLASALCAPTLAWQWIVAHDAAAALPAPGAVHVEEAILAPVHPDAPLDLELGPCDAAGCVVTCRQDGVAVARTTWRWEDV
ncbi:MAG: hypothetical protein HY904_15995 [Deltaproteobacteria bacterium]|nr:hypothetical protein [Deltaproteobacteria bacterium]